MKRSLQILVLLLVFVHGVSNQIFSDVNFGSRHSAFKVSAGALLTISSPSFTVDGTISQEVSSAIAGSPITFNGGILDESNVEIFLKAQFDPNAGETIQLTGNSFVDIEPGLIFKNMTVAGSNNLLEGQPRFTNNITFLNSSAGLDIGIQNVLNTNVNLSGGTLDLVDNLALADQVQIIGPGTISLNDFRLSLGGYYTNPWSTNLTFSGATDLVLNGDIVLTSNWTFTGTNRINGNGQTIDFSSGGTITISPGSVLYLNDVYIKGLGDGAGSFVWGSTTSELRLGGETIINLINDFHQAQGKVYIDGYTKFILKIYSWFFQYPNSHLIVNDRLWLDIEVFNPSMSYLPGQVRASRPLFLNHIFDYTTSGTVVGNVNQNIADGTLAIGPNGTIRELTDESAGLILDEEILFSGGICQDLMLNRNVSVGCNGTIEFACGSPLTLSSCGSTITFNNAFNPDGSPHPQFVITSGTTVTLQNITLANINANTFDIQPGGQLNIGSNVSFELSDNVTLSTGLINVLPSASIFKVIGASGTEQFNLLPSDSTQTTILRLGSNSLVLQNIEFNGLEFATYNADASIVLDGDASVGIRQDTLMNFDVEGSGNELVFRADQLNFSGTIAFLGTHLTNILSIRTAIDAMIQNKPGVRPGNPLINLLGESIILTSDANVAELQFADSNISLFLGNSNSFLIDQNSVLRGNRLEILNFPAKQMSGRFALDVVELSGEGIDPSFIRGGNFRAFKPAKTAFSRMRQNQEKIRNQKLQEILKTPKKQPVKHSLFGRPQKKSKHYQSEDNQDNLTEPLDYQLDAESYQLEDQEYQIETRGVSDLATMTRAVSIPAIPYDVVYEDTRIEVTNPIQGAHIKVRNAAIDNFFNQFGTSAIPFSMEMQGAAELVQSFDDNKDVVLETGIHVINVEGRANKITVTGNWTFGKKTLLFAPQAELTITVDEEATLKFEEGFSLDIEDEACLIFAGLGEVIFPNGMTFNLKGQRAAVIPTMSLHALDQMSDFGNEYRNIGWKAGLRETSKVGAPGKVVPPSDSQDFIEEQDGSIVFTKDSTRSASRARCTSQNNQQRCEIIPEETIKRVVHSGAVTSRAKLIFQDSILATLSTGAEMTIKGVGLVLIEDASFRILSNGLRIAPHVYDDINVEITGTGRLEIFEGGRVSTGLGTTSWDINREGNLDIFGGVLEFNSIEGVLTRGYVSEIKFTSNGTLFLRHDGRIILGQNKIESLTNPFEKIFNFVLLPVDIGGSGLVEFLGDPNQSFTGRLKIPSLETFQDAEMTFEKLALFLTQSITTLQFSTVFIDENGQTRVRTVTGALSAPLNPGDVIIGEQQRIVQGINRIFVIGQTASGQTFEINEAGTRL